jgi:hypothetical protein
LGLVPLAPVAGLAATGTLVVSVVLLDLLTLSRRTTARWVVVGSRGVWGSGSAWEAFLTASSVAVSVVRFSVMLLWPSFGSSAAFDKMARLDIRPWPDRPDDQP